MFVELLPTWDAEAIRQLMARNCFLEFYETQFFGWATKRRAAFGRPSSILGLLKAPVRPDVNGYAFGPKH
jgi:hypothetical protein